MALHLRTQLSNAVKAALLGRPTTGANVFQARTWPFEAETYAALLIWSPGGDSQVDAMDSNDATMPLARDERIVVEIVVRRGGNELQSQPLEHLLDAICAEVEPVMMNDAGIKALIETRTLVRTEKNSAVQGDARRGVCRLTYRVIYRTPAGDPTSRV